MGPLAISWKSIWLKPLSAAINILLVAFGIGILTVLLLASSQISNKLNQHSKGIDLVVGAKGSPLQLILSSIYYIDFPTGNIPLDEAEKIMQHPWVNRAVPLALGDNYNGYRIVGTDSNFVKLYTLKLEKGKFWEHDFETTIGARVADEQQLKVGDHFYGAHGLTASSDIHEHHAYKVTGILESQGNVTDNLILTNIASVWRMHDAEAEGEHDDDHHHEEKEITTVLIQYRSPMAVVQFPRMVNQSTNLQAASPAAESARLFSLIGVGLDTLKWFALVIILIAAISVFANLYNSLKERSYDLAIMRILGASRWKLFLIVVSEGIIITVAGTLIGIALGHMSLELIAHYQESSQAKLTGLTFIPEEAYLMACGLGIGIAAAIIPAMQAYRANISKILAKN
jgi:putative ABC transport system permease protein